MIKRLFLKVIEHFQQTLGIILFTQMMMLAIRKDFMLMVLLKQILDQKVLHIALEIKQYILVADILVVLFSVI